MKKIILILLILSIAGLAAAQNPFLRDGNDIHLKISTDKVGIGTGALSDKVTIASVAAETPLGIIGYPNHYNPYIALYNSDKVAIWKLYAATDWFTIGSTMDTTLALFVGKISKDWIKINGTGSFTKVIGTTITGTTGTITTLGSTTATLTHLETTDTTGIVLYNKNGTKYRVYISNSGAVRVSTVP
jgi:hypothetical protein